MECAECNSSIGSLRNVQDAIQPLVFCGMCRMHTCTQNVDRESWVEGSASRPPDPGNELSVNAPLISTLADGQNDGDRAGGSASRPPGPANDMKEDTSTIMHTTHNSSGGELPPCEQWCEPGGCEPFLQETTPSNRKPGGCEPSMPEDISEER